MSDDVRKYLAEEIALDCRDQHFSRREALHRLALLGISSAAATSLLAACGADPGPGSSSASATPSGSTASATPTESATATASASGSATASSPPPVLPKSLPTEEITFEGPKKVKLFGAWASAEKPKAGVLVIHENKGLNDHTRNVAGRFAAEGYAALALDLLSEEGGTAAVGQPADATAALGKADVERFVPNMRAGIDEIVKRAKVAKVGAIGFCFGGGMVWRLSASKDPRLLATAPFYGPLPDKTDFTGSKAAVLGVYGELDKRVNATHDAAEAALTKAGLVHELITYPGADHAFFNDTGQRFHQASATAVWAKVIEWFGKHLA